uniref:Uncharacterized protein n=1 Tax=viral metagenome TaxID=1070528 RepID=A0A6C0JB46_9ZZZZ
MPEESKDIPNNSIRNILHVSDVLHLPISELNKRIVRFEGIICADDIESNGCGNKLTVRDFDTDDTIYVYTDITTTDKFKNILEEQEENYNYILNAINKPDSHAQKVGKFSSNHLDEEYDYLCIVVCGKLVSQPSNSDNETESKLGGFRHVIDCLSLEREYFYDIFSELFYDSDDDSNSP